MDDTQRIAKAALINFETAKALIEMEAMKADNRLRERQDLGHSYGESEFFQLADDLEKRVKKITG